MCVSYDSAPESSSGQIEQISQSHPAHVKGQSSMLRACRHSFPLYISDTLPCYAPDSLDLWALGESTEDSELTSLTFGSAEQSGNTRSKYIYTHHIPGHIGSMPFIQFVLMIYT